MNEITLDTNLLPSPIREKFRTAKVSIQEHDGGVILKPLCEVSGLRGIAKGSTFTTEKLIKYRHEPS
ncbi:MAG: hypothetical protein FWC60_10610 [Firmicutes bacterium]|nr:hypothetical protein [Bacillota bacterium]